MKDKFLPFGIVLLVLAAVAVAVQVWFAVTWQGTPVTVGRGFGFHPGVFFPFWPLLLAGGFFFWLRRRRSPREALEVLAVEYAQGRIDRDEYLSRKAVLEERG